MKTPFNVIAESPSTLPQWTNYRQMVQENKLKVTPTGTKKRRYPLFSTICYFLEIGMAMTGKQFWIDHALKLRLEEETFHFDNLPPAFDGYRILHISDIHFDSLEGVADKINSLLPEEQVDLCIMTGDYRDSTQLDYEVIRPEFEQVIDAVKQRSCDGIVAVLGNHDGHEAHPFLTDLGVQVLVNESVVVERQQEQIILTGVDDVFYFYTQWAERALQMPLDGFKIALVHSPDLNQLAAECGYHLYLTGHTHGGQVCLPRPIITHGIKHVYSSGQWQLQQMLGYTSRGAGVSRLPLRINCPGEIAIHTLKKREQKA